MNTIEVEKFCRTTSSTRKISETGKGKVVPVLNLIKHLRHEGV
jgi:hypothetical protein